MYNPETLVLSSSPCVQLRDESYCRIRPVSAGDRDFLADCFQRLSPDSRRLRFFAAKSELSERDLSFLTSADGFDHIALGALTLNTQGEETEALGFVRCLRLEQVPDSADVSIAVADQVQRRGVGAALLERLMVLAHSAGIRHFVGQTLVENHGMRALARRTGGISRWQGDGIVEQEWSLREQVFRGGTPSSVNPP